MKPVTDKELFHGINEILVPKEFRKQGKYWARCVGNNVYLVINCQKSYWGPQHYLNAGLFISKGKLKKIPTLGHWHVDGRLNFEESEDELLDELLDLETDLPTQERFDELRKFLNTRIDFLIETFSNQKRARTFLEETSEFLCKQMALDYFGIKYEVEEPGDCAKSPEFEVRIEKANFKEGFKP